MTSLPDQHERLAALRLSTLPFVTAHRLRVLLASGTPTEVVSMLCEGGTHPAIARVSSVVPHGTDRSLAEVWRRELASPTSTAELPDHLDVRVLGMSGYPDCLALDPSAPAVLFTRGDDSVLAGRRVAIVGTRNATEHGRGAARRFGHELSEAGVNVVSGLARGIDAAAHRGVLESTGTGRPVGVVASGLDVVYPPEHDRLWSQVGEIGFLCSESPPGTAPEAFRFPLRNRIIAALSEVVLVVESRLEGGSLITVREALHRGVTVMAVPGATTTKASQGTNMLLRDGASVAIDTDDVLTALGLDNRRAFDRFDPRVPPVGLDARLLALFHGEPMTLDDVAASARDHLGSSFAATAVSLGRLEAAGWLICTSGWFERVRM
jgi:DNA processing protein